MTNAEIIKGLKAVRTIHNGNYAPFIDEAIKELEQNPCIQEKQANADKIDAVYIDGFKAGYSQARFDLEQEPILEKIREEIKSKKFGLTDTEDGRRIQSDIHAGFDGGIECALQIIDKYKAESE